MIVREMHVDGGVTVPFLASPAGPIRAASLGASTDSRAAGRIFIIVNGQSSQQYAVTSGRIPAILGRTYTTSSKATTARELAAATTFATAEHLDLLVTDIPAEVQTSSLDFHQAAMASMFELGRQRGLAGDAWRTAHTGATLAPSPDPTSIGSGSRRPKTAPMQSSLNEVRP